MKRLAVIPSDSINDYLRAGYDADWLRDYYNPCGFFDEVYLLSPHEDGPDTLGMKVVQTTASQFRIRLRELAIDVVRAYGGNWACRLACEHKVDGIPVIVSVHDTEPTRLYDSIRKADVVFCVSQAVKDLVTTKIRDPQKLWLLPNRVDFRLMRPYSPQETRDLQAQGGRRYTIVFVGRLAVEKNLDTLLKALSLLDEDYGLLIVGRGDRAPYEALARDLGIDARIVFKESIAHRDLARYFSWAHCLCMPSRWEGFGMVLIEAVASEAVVVASAVAPLTEIIVHGQNGLLVPDYENPQALADVIRRACTDDDLRRFLKQNARKSVEKFERSHIDRMEAEHYDKILRMKTQGSFRRSPWEKFLNLIRI